MQRESSLELCTIFWPYLSEEDPTILLPRYAADPLIPFHEGEGNTTAVEGGGAGTTTGNGTSSTSTTTGSVRAASPPPSSPSYAVPNLSDVSPQDVMGGKWGYAWIVGWTLTGLNVVIASFLRDMTLTEAIHKVEVLREMGRQYYYASLVGPRMEEEEDLGSYAAASSSFRDAHWRHRKPSGEGEEKGERGGGAPTVWPPLSHSPTHGVGRGEPLGTTPPLCGSSSSSSSLVHEGEKRATAHHSPPPSPFRGEGKRPASPARDGSGGPAGPPTAPTTAPWGNDAFPPPLTAHTRSHLHLLSSLQVLGVLYTDRFDPKAIAAAVAATTTPTTTFPPTRVFPHVESFSSAYRLRTHQRDIWLELRYQSHSYTAAASSSSATVLPSPPRPFASCVPPFPATSGPRVLEVLCAGYRLPRCQLHVFRCDQRRWLRQSVVPQTPNALYSHRPSGEGSGQNTPVQCLQRLRHGERPLPIHGAHSVMEGVLLPFPMQPEAAPKRTLALLPSGPAAPPVSPLDTATAHSQGTQRRPHRTSGPLEPANGGWVGEARAAAALPASPSSARLPPSGPPQASPAAAAAAFWRLVSIAGGHLPLPHPHGSVTMTTAADAALKAAARQRMKRRVQKMRLAQRAWKEKEEEDVLRALEAEKQHDTLLLHASLSMEDRAGSMRWEAMAYGGAPSSPALLPSTSHRHRSMEEECERGKAVEDSTRGTHRKMARHAARPPQHPMKRGGGGGGSHREWHAAEERTTSQEDDDDLGRKKTKVWEEEEDQRRAPPPPHHHSSSPTSSCFSSSHRETSTMGEGAAPSSSASATPTTTTTDVPSSPPSSLSSPMALRQEVAFHDRLPNATERPHRAAPPPHPPSHPSFPFSASLPFSLPLSPSHSSNASSVSSATDLSGSFDSILDLPEEGPKELVSRSFPSSPLVLRTSSVGGISGSGSGSPLQTIASAATSRDTATSPLVRRGSGGTEAVGVGVGAWGPPSRHATPRTDRLLLPSPTRRDGETAAVPRASLPSSWMALDNSRSGRPLPSAFSTASPSPSPHLVPFALTNDVLLGVYMLTHTPSMGNAFQVEEEGAFLGTPTGGKAGPTRPLFPHPLRYAVAPFSCRHTRSDARGRVVPLFASTSGTEKAAASSAAMESGSGHRLTARWSRFPPPRLRFPVSADASEFSAMLLLSHVGATVAMRLHFQPDGGPHAFEEAKRMTKDEEKEEPERGGPTTPEDLDRNAACRRRHPSPSHSHSRRAAEEVGRTAMRPPLPSSTPLQHRHPSRWVRWSHRVRSGMSLRAWRSSLTFLRLLEWWYTILWCWRLLCFYLLQVLVKFRSFSYLMQLLELRVREHLHFLSLTNGDLEVVLEKLYQQRAWEQMEACIAAEQGSQKKNSTPEKKEEGGPRTLSRGVANEEEEEEEEDTAAAPTTNFSSWGIRGGARPGQIPSVPFAAVVSSSHFLSYRRYVASLRRSSTPSCCGLHPVLPHQRAAPSSLSYYGRDYDAVLAARAHSSHRFSSGKRPSAPYRDFPSSASSLSFSEKMRCLFRLVFPLHDACRCNYLVRMTVDWLCGIALYLRLVVGGPPLYETSLKVSQYFLVRLHLHYLQWFESWPAGLKLNEDLCLALGFGTQTVVELWDVMMRWSPFPTRDGLPEIRHPSQLCGATIYSSPSSFSQCYPSMPSCPYWSTSPPSLPVPPLCRAPPACPSCAPSTASSIFLASFFQSSPQETRWSMTYLATAFSSLFSRLVTGLPHESEMWTCSASHSSSYVCAPYGDFFSTASSSSVDRIALGTNRTDAWGTTTFTPWWPAVEDGRNGTTFRGPPPPLTHTLPINTTVCFPTKLADYSWVVAGYTGLLLFCLLGASCGLAWIADITVYVTLHLRLLHYVTALLFNWFKYAFRSVYSQFRGIRYNPLRKRTFPYAFQADQLLAAVLLFAVLAFLMPTISVYYFYFSFIRISVWIVQDGLAALAYGLMYLPVYSFGVRCWWWWLHVQHSLFHRCGRSASMASSFPRACSFLVWTPCMFGWKFLCSVVFPSATVPIVPTATLECPSSSSSSGAAPPSCSPIFASVFGRQPSGQDSHEKECEVLEPSTSSTGAGLHNGGGIKISHPVCTHPRTVELSILPLSLPLSASLVVDFKVVCSLLLSPFTSTKVLRRLLNGETNVALDHLSALIPHLLGHPEEPQCVLPCKEKKSK